MLALSHEKQGFPHFVNRAEVQPCLVALCAGLIDSEIVSALQGLLLANPLVRGAALHALPSIPSFAAGVCPEDDELLAILMIGLHDPNEANQEAAVALWDMSGANIPASFVSTIPPYLSSPYADIRQAATEALVEGLETFPDSSGDVLNRCIAVFAGENCCFTSIGHEVKLFFHYPSYPLDSPWRFTTFNMYTPT